MASLNENNGAPPRVVFGDATDPRVIEALVQVVAAGRVQPVVIVPGEVTSAAERSRIAFSAGVEVVSVDDPEWEPRCSQALLDSGRVPDAAAAGSAVRDPLLFGALYARLGGAGAGIAGSLSTSANVVRSALVGVGVDSTRSGALVSSAFLMRKDGRNLTYADCAVVPDPTAQQLAQIAADAADFHAEVTDEKPKVAMLSFSSAGSAKHPMAEKVRSALELVNAARPDLSVEGEMQFDVAVEPSVAAMKFPSSSVGGHANVFIFPDLNAGNIALKITERFGEFAAIGSFLLGLGLPWADLSRGCSASDIVDVAHLLGTQVLSKF